MNKYIQKFIGNIILLHTLLTFVMLIVFDAFFSYQRFIGLKKEREELAKRVTENIELSIKTTGIYQNKPEDVFYMLIDNKKKLITTNISMTENLRKNILNTNQTNFQYAGLQIKKTLFNDAILGKLQIITAYSRIDIYNKIATFFGIALLISIFIVFLYYKLSYVLSQKWSIPLLSLYRTTEEFLDTVAHEMLTPLSYISIVNDDDRVKHSIERIKNILNGVLEIKKFDAIKASCNKIPTQIVMNAILQELSYNMKSKNLSLNLRIIPAEIVTYQNLFYILLRNLIDNAIKHNIENGFITIESFVNECYTLKIENSCTQDPESDKHIMHFGKGLGLYLIYKILNILKGKIDIVTSKDAFRVTINLPKTY